MEDNHSQNLREETRTAILEAGGRLLDRYGYRKTSMSDLAREAGIGRATLYLHFSSKEEVALAVIDRISAQIHAALRSIAREPGEADDRLRRMLAARVLLRFDSVGTHQQRLDDIYAAIRPAYLARRERHFEAEAAALAEVLLEGRAAGKLAFSDAGETAVTLLTATNSLLPYSLSPRELGQRDAVEAETTRLADLIIQGLKSPLGDRL